MKILASFFLLLGMCVIVCAQAPRAKVDFSKLDPQGFGATLDHLLERINAADNALISEKVLSAEKDRKLNDLTVKLGTAGQAILKSQIEKDGVQKKIDEIESWGIEQQKARHLAEARVLEWERRALFYMIGLAAIACGLTVYSTFSKLGLWSLAVGFVAGVAVYWLQYHYL